MDCPPKIDQMLEPMLNLEPSPDPFFPFHNFAINTPNFTTTPIVFFLNFVFPFECEFNELDLGHKHSNSL